MQTVTTLPELVEARRALTGTLGLVPTMGFLHEGHVSLVRRAKSECAHVGASIFVNPLQFGPSEDLARYPRDLPRDLRLLKDAGADLVWTPAPEVMYPEGFQTYIEVENVTQPLEGKARPGHFRGVATVVAKLLNAFTPDRAYFGQKDAQQVVVIQRMVRDLNMPFQVAICPIVREPDGLAMSSRNVYLTPEQRHAAPVLYRSLMAAQHGFDAGERSGNALRESVRSVLSAEPLARVEYVSVADPVTLQELERVETGTLVSMAVRIGTTRLIDNLILSDAAPPGV